MKQTLIAATAGAFALAGLAWTFTASTPAAAGETIYVVKTPTCGCCAAWVDLARNRGYTVKVTDTDDYEGMKREAGVPGDMQACHTSRIGGYVVEGHMPFAAIEKLLSEKPDVHGIAVPGMPGGSPGMGDDPSAKYAVYAWGGSADADKPPVFFRAGT